MSDKPTKLTRREELLIAGFIPPWLDMDLMCVCLPYTKHTVEALVANGTLPPGRKRGGKLVWKWSEVDEKLTLGKVGTTPDSQADEIRDATRRAVENRAGH